MTPADPGGALAGVLRVLDLDEVDADTYRGDSLPLPGGRVFGGQVLAQALLAAGRTVAPDRLPHSVHGYFLRAGDVGAPIELAVERLRDGGSFSARRTHALQGGVPILSMITSFQLEQPGVNHATAPPTPVPDPEDLPDPIPGLAALGHPMADFWLQSGPFDVRHVGGSLFGAPASTTEHQLVWMRARGAVPDDPLLHRALLAFGCDQVMLEPVMLRHGLSWTSRGMALASLDHAMWWHRPVRVDDWLLFDLGSPSAQGGRGLGTARVFTRDGDLVASIAQEGMVRVAG